MLDTRVVGALACQQDSYLQSLEAKVVSCLKATAIPDTRATQKEAKKSKSSKADAAAPELWQIEFTDSVLFPEGGGQPSDHGTIIPISSEKPSEAVIISNVQRHGLRCVAYSPQPLEPGTSVRQTIDFSRRWDHMQQHTGQHLLSAIMDTYPNLETLGWGMGAGDNPNYVDLPRKPSEDELREIEDKCNTIVSENVPITVESSSNGADSEHIPKDYDSEKGVVRVIKIGDVDSNPCCGTHLRQTSHITLILLLSSTSVHGGKTRLSFICGDRAIRLATTSITSLRSIASTLGSNPAPTETVSAVTRLKDSAAADKRRATKLLQELAHAESKRATTALRAGANVFVHRGAEDGAEFLPMVTKDVREIVAQHPERTVVLASGEAKTVGQIMILGQSEGVVAAMKELAIDVKGGGRPGQWQGKVVEWKKGEVEKLGAAVLSMS